MMWVVAGAILILLGRRKETPSRVSARVEARAARREPPRAAKPRRAEPGSPKVVFETEGVTL